MVIRTNGNKGWIEVRTKLAVVVSALALLALGWSVASGLILVKVDINQFKADCVGLKAADVQLRTADSLLDKRLDAVGGKLATWAVRDSVARADVVRRLMRIEDKLDR